MKAFAFLDNEIYPGTLVEDIEAIRANLTARLSIIHGEYKKNTSLGVPLFTTKDETDLYVQRIILGTSGVTGITEFSSSISNKVYKCQFTAETIYGGLQYE